MKHGMRERCFTGNADEQGEWRVKEVKEEKDMTTLKNTNLFFMILILLKFYKTNIGTDLKVRLSGQSRFLHN